MPKKTQHYQLNQYEPQDSFLRTDFNEDNAKIDAALYQLSGKCSIVTGTYVGDSATQRKISLGFRPKAVLLNIRNGEMYRYPTTAGGLALDGAPLRSGNDNDNYNQALEITEDGFTVGYRSDFNVYTNHDKRVYHYIAFG